MRDSVRREGMRGGVRREGMRCEEGGHEGWCQEG